MSKRKKEKECVPLDCMVPDVAQEQEDAKV